MVDIHTDRVLCDVCQQKVEPNTRWVILNRYAFGVGTNHGMRWTECDDGEDWNAPDDETSPDVACGPLLHWPTCLMEWIELQMISTEVDVRTRS